MISRFEFWAAVVLLTIMIWSNHAHLEETACAQGVERLCHTHLW